MTEKVKQAENIILNLKKTGHPNISDLIDELKSRKNQIYSLEDKISKLTQSENFTKDDNLRLTTNFKET